MAIFTYIHEKDPVNPDQLAEEIRESSIAVALDNVATNGAVEGVGPTVVSNFKAELSDEEEDTLDSLVADHVADFTPPVDVTVTASQNAQGEIVISKTQPTTRDGEIQTIQGNMSNVTGNKLINWTMFYTLASDTSIDERFVIPSGVTASLEFVQGYSSAVPFSVELNFYRGPGNRINPAIDVAAHAIQEVDGYHAAGVTEVTLKGGLGFSFSAMETDRKYGFSRVSDGKSFLRKVTDKDGPTKTVTLNSSTPFELFDGDKFGLVDRPISRLGGDATNGLMDFEVAPTFPGDGDNFLELIIKNESLVDSGDVFAVVNGWTTPTVSGTIPGSGGSSGVDEDA